MEFTNSQISLDQIPKAHTADLQPIDRNYHKIATYQWLIFWFIVLIAAGVGVFFIKKLHAPLWLGLISLVFILLVYISFRFSYLSFRNKAFAVREHDILYQTGWLVKSLHACPYNRIQHCSVDSGVFERKFGLSTLKLFTAAGNDTEMEIPGLRAELANDLREMILQKNTI
jgi:uncharacterized protein